MSKGLIFTFCFLLFLGQLNARSQATIDTENGNVLIKGEIRNFKKSGKYSDVISITQFNWINKTPERINVKIDSNGFFSKTIYLNNATDVTLNYNSNFKSFFLFPNDTVYITIEDNIIKTDNPIDSLLAIYYEGLKPDGTKNKKKSGSNFSTYKSYRDSIYKLEIKKTEEFLATAGAPLFFSLWLKNRNSLTYFSDLTNYCLWHKDNEQIDSVLLVIFDSINYRHTDYKKNSTYYILLNKLNTLLYKTMVFNGSCSKEIKAKALKKNAEPEINNNQVPVEEIKLGLFHCFIDYISVIPNEDIREVLISNQFLQMYETTDVNYPADSLLSIISNPLIQERFLMQYENISSLKNINSRIEIPTQNEGEILFENIKKMYPGYVICFNFWGTWCKPCYDHLKELEANKNNLKAGKVVNVYLCCQSPEKIWEKRIEELHVEGVHYLLNNEQYVFFSERFGIEGFPGTILVNRNGEISIDHTNNIKALINKINILANQ